MGRLLATSVLVALPTVVGCAVGTGKQAALTPQITGVSTNEAAVGDTMTFYCNHCATADEGSTDVHFVGQFIPENPAIPTQPVDLTINFEAQEDPKLGTVIEWKFGQFQIPFADGATLGTFKGQVFAANYFFNGTNVEQPEETRLETEIRVLPSLVVRDFRAVGPDWIADCKYPAANISSGLGYVMRVECVGCEPYSFVWRVSAGAMLDGAATDTPTEVTQTSGYSNQQAILIQAAPVPAHTDGYQMSVNVQAPSIDGVRREVEHKFLVRKPFSVFFEQEFRLAQLMQPRAMSGCISGGQLGSVVTYKETESETRSRTTSENIVQGWEQSYGQQHNSTYGMANTVGKLTTDAKEITVTDATTYGFSESSTKMFSLMDSNTFAQTMSMGSENGWSSTDVFGTVKRRVTDYAFDREGLNKKIGVKKTDSRTDDGSGTDTEAYTHGNSSSTANSEASSDQASSGRNTTGTIQAEPDFAQLSDEEKLRKQEESKTKNYTGGQNGKNTFSSGTTDTHGTQNRSETRNTVGSQYERTQTYSEMNSTSHTQSVSNTNSYNQARTDSQNISQNLMNSQTTTETVSSTNSKSLQLSVDVLPLHYVVLYRQTAHLVRYGAMVAYDLCGNSTSIGDIQLDDWAWAPGFGISQTCPPLPKSSQPPATCFVPASECIGDGQ